MTNSISESVWMYSATLGTRKNVIFQWIWIAVNDDLNAWHHVVFPFNYDAGYAGNAEMSWFGQNYAWGLVFGRESRDGLVRMQRRSSSA